MTRPHILILLASMTLASCGDRDQPESYPELVVSEPDPNSGARLRGRVLFTAENPGRPRLAVGNPWCSGRNNAFRSREVLVHEGGLRDVLVWVDEGLESYRFAHEKKPVTLDQADCRFEPHVLAVRVHQPVEFRNSDTTAHNVNTKGSRAANGFVRNTPTSGSRARHQFRHAEIGIPVLCDLHPWMKAWIHVMPHPFHATSAAEGEFALPRPLPPGRYTLKAWHAKYGTKSQVLDVPESSSDTLEVNFTFP